ncbi:tetratricopeptide repeat protein [Phycicoccus sp. CSK15P-2]|uniref:AfsR/SARP family transcriptional regulator n=1 Tax=Phycicoccus sp. CSK15P-2 TaxID=2807627 RepID=UPI00194F1825|nr:BTAD domain-containing putative transcriptional regulator [Phycicoccus sp. CSK15P-2]MBM6406057.1 tetratricopeptide repeat protein [Phycicoccus sp. CSK15P-2]
MSAPVIRVEMLAALRVLVDGEEVDLGPPKQRAAFLALAADAGSVVPRDVLVDRVWGERVPATATGSLHTYVSGLRRALRAAGDPLSSSDTGYALVVDDDAVDLRRVQRLTEEAGAARADDHPDTAVAILDDALTSWPPGPVLPGLPGPFAEQQRGRLADLRVRLLVERAEMLLAGATAGGDAHGSPVLAAAAGELAQHVGDHPFDERMRRSLMVLLHRVGRTADALAQYQDLRDGLARELGLDPAPETRAVQAVLLRSEEDPPHLPVVETPREQSTPAPGAHEPALARQLPPPLAGFVGRADSVEEMVRAAAAAGDRPRRVVMVVGVGGIGKTALALHCVRLLHEQYPDGVLHLNMRGFDPTHPALDPAQALHRLLRSLGVTTVPDAHDDRVALWRSTMAERRMIVLLDNAKSADQVEDLLPGSPGCFVVVTSRNRLSALAVRHGARRVTLGPLSTTEAAQLLGEAVGPERVAAEPSAVGRLTTLCDGLPLALRVAAERVEADPSAPLAVLVAGLEDERHRLDTLQLEDDELCSVRAALSWSVAALDDAGVRAFRLLGVLPGTSLTSLSAGALLDLPPRRAHTVLDTLAAHHLVQRNGSRFTMHDLTRAYAGELAEQHLTEAERDAARARLSGWYVASMSTTHTLGAAPLPFEVPQPPAHEIPTLDDEGELLLWCSEEWPNLRPIIAVARRTGNHAHTWQLAYLLFHYFYTAGALGDWVDVLRSALRSATALGDRLGQAALLNHLSVASSRRGENGDAVRHLRRGLELLDAQEHRLYRVSLLGNLASTLREAKHYQAALPYAHEALELATRSGSAYYATATHDVLCELLAELGQYELALQYGQAGLLRGRDGGSVIHQANLLVTLGVAEQGLGRPARAREHFRRAEELARQVGDRYHEARALFGLARTARSQPDVAVPLAERALAHFHELASEEGDEVRAFLDGFTPSGRRARRPLEDHDRRREREVMGDVEAPGA